MNGSPQFSQGTLARTGSPVRASVSAGGVETSYLRAGCGPTVLLLVLDQSSDAVAASLPALAEHFRVLLPQVTASTATHELVTGFLDGVGVARLSIVTTEDCAGTAAKIAAEDPSRIEQVVVLRGAWTAQDVLAQLNAPAVAQAFTDDTRLS